MKKFILCLKSNFSWSSYIYDDDEDVCIHAHLSMYVDVYIYICVWGGVCTRREGGRGGEREREGN